MDGLVPVIISAVVAYVIWRVIKILVWYKRIRDSCLKIPGPRPHWLWGNLLEMPDSIKYTELAMETMNKGSKLYCLWAGPIPSVGTVHPDSAKVLLRSTEPKARGIADGYRMLIPWIGEGLLISDGALWERSRRLLTPAFHFEILRGYVPVYNGVAEEFMRHMWDKSQSGDSIDVFQYVSKATLDTMLRCAMSYEGNVQDPTTNHPYVEAVNRLTHLMWTRMLSPMKFPDFLYQFTSEGRESIRHSKFVHNFTEQIIAKRRKQLESGCADIDRRHPDFLDVLLTAKDDSGIGLTDLEIRNEVDTFAFEGHDTTASAVSWAIYALGKYPKEQDKVYREVESVLKDKDEIVWSDLHDFHHLTCFIKEVLRYYSPVPLVARSHKTPLVLDGIEVPVGPRIDINIYCIHHNPEVWPDHTEFKPSRFEEVDKDRDPYAFVPFSAGSRNCIGQHFVLDEIKVLLAKLIQRFEVKLDLDHKTEINPEVVTRSTNGIKVFLQKR